MVKVSNVKIQKLVSVVAHAKYDKRVLRWEFIHRVNVSYERIRYSNMARVKESWQKPINYVLNL